MDSSKRTVIPSSVHGKELRMNMVNAVSLEDQARARYAGQFVIKQTADALGGYGQLGQNVVRQLKCVARMMSFGNYHTESRRVWINGEKSQMIIVLPNFVRWSFTSDNFAEYAVFH